ncbi:uncharacterized protein BO95DRAFT_439962 [Aspergillus brunneoviolaceus CBS 621.78]|uniref:Uncharacterized protein n=1 Tax=Aspergillus brunneoviolaceus CBS 621.78 TaxID=1450534 RepID=A0ACD1GI60_9EURO|nr:hypothetical protein BO95DRAFT_439962 [Aspergillus brunneoviolaceus CBS 621.78]RAH48850.1 hypothetical protein BO95DRAFT_439962 [Aspergillus brunneoviolaceus CBS 621.78]
MSIRTLSDTDFEDSTLKRARTDPTAHRLCYDWMIVQGNCHYARDRAAFTSYRPVTTVRLQTNIFNPMEELEVAGVGTVEIPVMRSLTDPTNPNHNPFDNTQSNTNTHTLVLENVLHIPEAVCNGFNPLLYGSSMSCTAESWTGADRAGTPLWVATPFAGGSRLVLAGAAAQLQHQQGVSELIAGRYYTLSLYISPAEKAELMG